MTNTPSQARVPTTPSSASPFSTSSTRNRRSSSGGYRHTGENGFGYRYGSTFLSNVAYEHKLGPRPDGVLELNFRHAHRDRVDADGTVDDDTGGSTPPGSR